MTLLLCRLRHSRSAAKQASTQILKSRIVNKYSLLLGYIVYLVEYRIIQVPMPAQIK